EATTTQLPLNYTASVDVDYKATGDYDCSAQPDDLMVFSCVCLAIALCGLAGNGRVLWLLGFHVKKKPFTIYVLNLAVADFCLLLLFALILLSFLTLVVFCLFEFLTFFVAFVTALEFLCHFFDLSSLGLLAAISTERCASVL
ncbi:MRGRD protein, partial [Rhinopomastus cyanomelas]|nr:MRGRD protein [Rhinopomastus cyanomelas]